MIKLAEIGKTCKKCGTFFLGNKCPKCGYEVLPTTPKPVMRGKEKKSRGKKKLKGVYY